MIFQILSLQSFLVAQQYHLHTVQCFKLSHRKYISPFLILKKKNQDKENKLNLASLAGLNGTFCIFNLCVNVF